MCYWCWNQWHLPSSIRKAGALGKFWKSGISWYKEYCLHFLWHHKERIQFYDVCVHPSFSSTWRRHFVIVIKIITLSYDNYQIAYFLRRNHFCHTIAINRSKPQPIIPRLPVRPLNSHAQIRLRINQICQLLILQ